MTTRLQTQALLDRARTMQAENDKSLIFAREDVDNWLNTVCRRGDPGAVGSAPGGHRTPESGTGPAGQPQEHDGRPDR